MQERLAVMAQELRSERDWLSQQLDSRDWSESEVEHYGNLRFDIARALDHLTDALKRLNGMEVSNE